MTYANPDGIAFADPDDQYARWNLQPPALRERLRAALCGEDPDFQDVIELRGPSGSGKGYLLRAAAHAAGRQGHPWVCATLDLDAASPDGVLTGDYLNRLMTELRARVHPGAARRAAALQTLIDAGQLNLGLQVSGWDRLAWLPLSIELELPLSALEALFRRHWQPDLHRPPPERFIETLRELIAQVAARHAGAGLLLQIPEQRQPEASVRGLLLEWLASLPGLVLAFTQDETSPRPAYANWQPLALGLGPLLTDDLSERLRAGLGAHELPRWLLHSVATRAGGAPGLAALTLADWAARGLIGADADGCWRLCDPDQAPDQLQQLIGPTLFAPLEQRLAALTERAGPMSPVAPDLAAALRRVLDLACLCGEHSPFEPLAACLDAPVNPDDLLDLIDAELVAPTDGGEPTLIYLGGRHPDFPQNEVFGFHNPLLALHLRQMQSRRERQTRAAALLGALKHGPRPDNRGVLALHRSLLTELADASQAEALAGELFYWIDAAHADSARDQLIADLKARRIAPEALWLAYKQHGERWPIWRRIAWLEAYGAQPHGVPVGMRGAWLNRLAKALRAAGELERALGLAEEGLKQFRASAGADSADAAAALSVIGNILLALGQHDAALARFEEALLIARKALPAGHPAIATSLNNIATVLEALGRHDEALARHEEALLIRRKALPAGHPDIAGSLNNIATVLNALGRHDEALARHEEALLIQRKALPAGHPDIAQSLNNIAMVLDALGRHAEALARHEEALLIQRKALPAGHPNIAGSLENMGIVLTTLGRPAEARAAWEEAFAIHRARATDGPGPLIWRCLAYAQHAARHGDRDGAAHWLDRVRALLPADAPDLAALREAIATAAADLERDTTGAVGPDSGDGGKSIGA